MVLSLYLWYFPWIFMWKPWTLKPAFGQLVSTLNGNEFSFVLSYFRHQLVSLTLLLCRLAFYFPSLLQQQLRIGYNKVTQQKITARFGFSIDAMLLWVF